MLWQLHSVTPFIGENSADLPLLLHRSGQAAPPSTRDLPSRLRPEPPGLQRTGPATDCRSEAAHITCPSQPLPTFAWLGLTVPCRALEAHLPFALLYKEHVLNLIVAPPPPPVLSGEHAPPAQKLKTMTRPTKWPASQPAQKTWRARPPALELPAPSQPQAPVRDQRPRHGTATTRRPIPPQPSCFPACDC